MPPVHVETFVNDMCAGIVDEEEDAFIHFEENNTEIEQRVQVATNRAKTKEQLQQRTITMGFQHGHFNPLPSSWCYPKMMNMIQLITMYQMGR